MRLFGKSIAELWGAVRKHGKLMLDNAAEVLQDYGIMGAPSRPKQDIGSDHQTQEYIRKLDESTTRRVSANSSNKGDNTLAKLKQNAANTVIEKQHDQLTISDGFKSASSQKIEFKTKSYINKSGVLTTDLIFPKNMISGKYTPDNIAKTYERLGIKSNHMQEEGSPHIIRFTGEDAINLQNHKSMTGRLKLKARPDDNETSLDMGQTLKSQSWKIRLSSRTGELYAALPLRGEKSPQTQKILRALRDLGVKPVKQKDRSGAEHMFIKGPNASKLFNVGIFGNAIAKEVFDLVAPSKSNEGNFYAPEQVIKDEDLVALGGAISSRIGPALPTIKPSFS